MYGLVCHSHLKFTGDKNLTDVDGVAFVTWARFFSFDPGHLLFQRYSGNQTWLENPENLPSGND